MKQEMLGLRHRWHGLLRRRLERLRERIDRRIERLDEKQRDLARSSAKPAEEAPKPPVSAAHPATGHEGSGCAVRRDGLPQEKPQPHALCYNPLGRTTSTRLG